MIVVDSSVLVAILDHEPERVAFFQVFADADGLLVSAVNYQETGQVMFSRRGPEGVIELDSLLRTAQAEIVAHDEELSRLAVEAFQSFGKGIHARARLNLGDCAAYALSKKAGAPLLFKGEDFAATDVASVLPAAS